MREVRIQTFAELHETLFEGSWDASLARHRSSLAFRGMPDASVVVACSLARLGPRAMELERPLLRTFRKYARRLADVDDSVFCWLALAQHHGLPTRLVDWTFSPYVALHFMTATPAAMERDGAVVCVDYVRAKAHLPKGLAAILRDEDDANVFTAEMLARAASSLASFDALGEDFVAFFEPPSLDERIVNQYALFSLCPRPTATDVEAFVAARGLGFKIVVPASLKQEVRDKLDQANVTERVLFPGLDGLTRWVERYYTPYTPRK
jgi:hypothetical protein